LYKRCASDWYHLTNCCLITDSHIRPLNFFADTLSSLIQHNFIFFDLISTSINSFKLISAFHVMIQITIFIHIKKKKTKPTVFVLFFNSMSCCKKPEKRGQVHQMGGRARYWFRWDFLARFSNHIQSNTSCRRKKQEKKIGMRSFRDRIRFLSF